MARIFISFLGVGHDGDGYDALTYYDGDSPVGAQTTFIQRAGIEMIGPESVDRVMILCTRESFSDFFPDLKDELVEDLGMDQDRIHHEIISTKLNKQKQWNLFSIVNEAIGKDDRVIFDFTNGFRLLSIILSAAISFIQTVKPDVVLEHVLYGQKVSDTEGALVDMKDFYVINDWAHSVDRFAHSADISGLAALASKTESRTAFSGLADESLIKALENLSSTIKDVHANEIGSRTHEAIHLIQKLQESARFEERELLNLIAQKFDSTAVAKSDTEFYCAPYLDTQLNFARILTQHGLYMQAFTVMRELIVSIGMMGCKGKYQGKKINSDNGRRYRRRFGETFCDLCQFPRNGWKYTDETKIKSDIEMDSFNHISSFYDLLEEKGVAGILQSFVSDMIDYRNGFDHAWTGKSGVKQGASEKAEEYLSKIEQVLSMLKTHQII